MFSRSISFTNLSLVLPHKVCFEGFTDRIFYGDRIAFIGNNGSGKSTLLKMVLGEVEPSSGSLVMPDDVIVGYVPQVPQGVDSLSGAQRFNHFLTRALSIDPNILILDEPTNHLDAHNKKKLIRMLRKFHGALLVISHDVELLRSCFDTIWSIEHGQIHTFKGAYDDYVSHREQALQSYQEHLTALRRQKKQVKRAAEQEKKRYSQSKRAFRRENDRNIKGFLKGESSKTTGKKSKLINASRENIDEALQDAYEHKIIKPTFSIDASQIGSKNVITIRNGSVGYDTVILEGINLSIGSRDRVALAGRNGSGKTTLIKALLGEEFVSKSGEWECLPRDQIGYLDQHYDQLDSDKKVMQIIQGLFSGWTEKQFREHLNRFLFRKNQEVQAKVKQLSGGENVRLVLAMISAKTPRLLILDEITNNLDLQTRAWVIHVLKEYPGAMVVISHDNDFLKAVGIKDGYIIEDGVLQSFSME